MLRTSYSLLNANLNVHSLVLWILFLLIDAERLTFSSLKLVLARRSLVLQYFLLANCLYVFLGWGIIMEGAGGEISYIDAWDIPNICLRQTWEIPDIYLRYDFDIPEIFLRYDWEIPDICVYTRDMSDICFNRTEICLRYNWDISKICLRYT